MLSLLSCESIMTVYSSIAGLLNTLRYLPHDLGQLPMPRFQMHGCAISATTADDGSTD